jgi:MoaA/NifB/PqqE/SkfB family radical SAM enzyme
MPDVTIGHLREERFVDIWRHSETCMKMVDRDNYHYKCPTYRHICGGCRARAFAYGDLIGPDPKCAVYQRLMGEGGEADIELKTDLEAVAL